MSSGEKTYSRKWWAERLYLVQAWSEGKDIEMYWRSKKEWRTMDIPSFTCDINEYRIKPKRKTACVVFATRVFTGERIRLGCYECLEVAQQASETLNFGFHGFTYIQVEDSHDD